MVKTKAIIIILIGGVLASFLFYGVKVYAGTLSCVVRNPGPCIGDEVEIFEMKNTTNSHAGLTAASYNNLVCCTLGVAGLGNDCNATDPAPAVALKLSGTSNAHVRRGTGANYPSATNACISVPTGGNVSVGYVTSPTTCVGAGYDTTLGSMIGTTNSHIGNGGWTAGTTKICATASAGLSTAIEIRAQDGLTEISTITFPSSTISTEVTNPSNSESETQAFGSSSLPVATLVTSTAYIAHITITSLVTWTDVATDENYYIDTAHARNITVSTFNTNKVAYSSWGVDADTGVTLATVNANDLYLSIDLTASAGKSGTSTLTILGET